MDPGGKKDPNQRYAKPEASPKKPMAVTIAPDAKMRRILGDHSSLKRSIFLLGNSAQKHKETITPSNQTKKTKNSILALWPKAYKIATSMSLKTTTIT